VLFVVLCGVWFHVLSRCSFISYWKIYISQLQIQPMIWASTLQIRKHGYFSDLDFIILFVSILPMYAINLGVVSLFADSPFTFLVMFGFDVLYRFEWMNIVFCFCQKKSLVPTFPKKKSLVPTFVKKKSLVPTNIFVCKTQFWFLKKVWRLVNLISDSIKNTICLCLVIRWVTFASHL